MGWIHKFDNCSSEFRIDEFLELLDKNCFDVSKVRETEEQARMQLVALVVVPTPLFKICVPACLRVGVAQCTPKKHGDLPLLEDP